MSRTNHHRGAERSGSGSIPTGGFAKGRRDVNNNGHCRKFDAGTMCRAVAVTRDEIHLNAGRANTLRLALSGPARRQRR